MKKDENKELNQETANQEQPKKGNIFKRVWNKFPKPVKVIIIGAGAVGGTMVAGKLINVDRKGYYEDPYGELPFNDNPGTETGGES